MDEKTRLKLLSSFLTFLISSTAISFFFYQAVVIKYRAKVKKGAIQEVVVDLTLIPDHVDLFCMGCDFLKDALSPAEVAF
jgi:hypothetical protein